MSYKNKEDQKKWRENHRDYMAAYNKAYRQKNLAALMAQKNKYYHDNKEEILRKQKEKWHSSPEYREKKRREAALYYSKRDKEKMRALKRIYQRNKIKTDIQFRLKMNLRSRLLMAIKSDQRVGSAIRDLGCSIAELKMYLEGQFKDGMTWANYGLRGWHIDHKIPLDLFDLADRAQFVAACHYSNLQPLWAKENFSKGNRI